MYQPTAVGTKWVYDDHGKDWTREIVDAVSREGETILSIRINDQFNVTTAVTATGVPTSLSSTPVSSGCR